MEKSLKWWAVEEFFPEVRPERASYLVNVSQRWRYLYMEVPKAACSTIKRTLHRLELGPDGPLPESVHDRAASPLLSPESAPEAFLLAQYHPDYLRFAFVRNPFTRVVSAYLDKIVTSDWERARLLPTLGLSPSTVVSLKEFLLAVRRQDIRDMDIHWLPQSTILSGIRKLTFIGRFESLEADMERVLGTITQERTAEIVRHAPHVTNAAQRVLELVGPEERNLILDIYAKDFAAFCYSTDPRFASQ